MKYVAPEIKTLSASEVLESLGPATATYAPPCQTDNPMGANWCGGLC